MIVNPDVEKYIASLASSPLPVFDKMHQLAEERDFPIVGPLVGRFLFILIEFGHVHTILECGSGFGYAAAWMAMALPENGKLYCIEYDQKNIDQARAFLEEAEVLHKVTFLQGDAMEIVPTLRQGFDLIFNDIDKKLYPQILPELLNRLRTGGVLLTDNVLWSGKVATDHVDPDTEAIRELNRLLLQYPHMVTSILPLRDGLSMSIKLRGEED